MGCCCARRRATSREERAEERAVFAAERRHEYYAIRRGRGGFRGVVETWAECADLTSGVPHNAFKKFSTLQGANAFLNVQDPEPQRQNSHHRRFRFVRTLEQGQEE